MSFGGLHDTSDWPASLCGRGLVCPTSSFQLSKDSPGLKFSGLRPFSVVSVTRYLVYDFWSPHFGLVLLGSIRGEPPERAYVAGFLVSGLTGEFYECPRFRMISFTCILVCVLRHTRILVPSLPEAVAYLPRTLDKARAEAHWPAG